MLSSASNMARQRRPTGPTYYIDKTWKDETQLRMKKQGILPADLARKIACKPSAISYLFGPICQQSRLVPKVHHVLGLPPPPAAQAREPDVERDEARRRLDRIWKELTPEQRELLLGIGAQMKRRD